ncbi:MAG: hypothetical protein ACK4HF_04475 [Paracoccaceae bacterium]
MTIEILICDADGALHDQSGRRFDAWHSRWRDGPAPAGPLRAVGAVAALSHLAAQGGRRMIPAGVIGPRTATPEQLAMAEALGEALAVAGIPVLCGGKTGVMEAVARGCTQNGGFCLAFLPEDDWRVANDFVTLPLATGIGKARNVLIAQASAVLIAVGGEYGTLSEVAFGLHFDKPVFGLCGAPDVPGVRRCNTVAQVMEGVSAAFLDLS